MNLPTLFSKIILAVPGLWNYQNSFRKSCLYKNPAEILNAIALDILVCFYVYLYVCKFLTA